MPVGAATDVPVRGAGGDIAGRGRSSRAGDHRRWAVAPGVAIQVSGRIALAHGAQIIPCADLRWLRSPRQVFRRLCVRTRAAHPMRPR
jgi:hypothetical protein